MGLFSKKEKMKYIQPEAFTGAPQYRLDIATAAKPGAMERLGRAGQTYPGQLTAPISEYEQRSLGTLGDYLDQPMPGSTNLSNLSRGELEKTLGGEEYDPTSGPYYQAYRTAMLNELQTAKDRIANQTAASDSFRSGHRVEKYLGKEGEMTDQLGMVLGQLFERERERRLGAVPMAEQYAQSREGDWLRRIGAAQGFGGLGRNLEQAGLDREKEEWIRSLNDLGIPLDVALGLSTWQPNAMMMQYGGGQKDWVKDTQGIMGMLGGLGKVFAS